MRLLLVEDDPALAEGIAEFLRGQGDEVEVEDDGMRADRRLQDDGYDFVLLDVGLPGLGGYELVRRIRKRGQRMPVIVITGFPVSNECRTSSRATSKARRASMR